VPGKVMDSYKFAPDIETASRDNLKIIHLEKLQRILVHAFKNVPHYDQSFREAGVSPADLNSLDDLAKFPFTVKDDLRNNYPFDMFAVAQKDIYPRSTNSLYRFG
jgi:phenylacetate-CoA ligase